MLVLLGKSNKKYKNLQTKLSTHQHINSSTLNRFCIADETFEFGAANRTMAEQATKFVGRERGNIVDGSIKNELRRGKFGHCGGLWRAIVWTDYLTHVAAVDVPAEAYIRRQCATVFDGQSRQASSAIHPLAGRNSACRASLNATSAVAASCRAGLVGSKGVGCNDFGEEKERAATRYDELIVRTHKTNAGTLRPVAFADRGSVDTRAAGGAGALRNEVGDLAKSAANNFVIVVAVSIISELRQLGAAAHCREVVHRQRNDRLGAVEKERRASADVAIFFHISEFSVASGSNPTVVGIASRVVDVVGTSKAAGIES